MSCRKTEAQVLFDTALDTNMPTKHTIWDCYIFVQKTIVRQPILIIYSSKKYAIFVILRKLPNQKVLDKRTILKICPIIESRRFANTFALYYGPR